MQKSKRHNILIWNVDRTMQSIDSIETYFYRSSKTLASIKEEVKCNKIKKQCQKWLKFDDVIKKLKKTNVNWPQIPDHPYRELIIGGSGSGKTNSIFNLISHQLDIDKIYSYAKDLFESKCQFVIKK